VFCRIADTDPWNQIFYADDHAIAILDIGPATRGHTLAIPRRHSPDIFTIQESSFGEVAPYTGSRVGLKIAFNLRACPSSRATEPLGGKTSSTCTCTLYRGGATTDSFDRGALPLSLRMLTSRTSLSSSGLPDRRRWT
jgi:hypothetical protein